MTEWQPSGPESGTDDSTIRRALWRPVTVPRHGVIILTAPAPAPAPARL